MMGIEGIKKTRPRHFLIIYSTSRVTGPPDGLCLGAMESKASATNNTSCSHVEVPSPGDVSTVSKRGRGWQGREDVEDNDRTLQGAEAGVWDGRVSGLALARPHHHRSNVCTNAWGR